MRLSFFLLATILSSTVFSATYRVSNGRITRNGSPIIIAGANWYGFEDQNIKIPQGLWVYSLSGFLQKLKSLRFNALRLPYCPQLFQNAIPSHGIDTSLNPELSGKGTLDILDVIMDEAQRNQMHVLLDFHKINCNAEEPTEGLWYSSGYSESQWLQHLSTLATRYRKNEYFLGLDIKSDPHDLANWGNLGADDFRMAAEKAANMIWNVNPDILIFVEGIGDTNRLPANCGGKTGYMWGGNLEPLRCFPINQNVLNRNNIVFAPHLYGPDVYPSISYFYASDFPKNMPTVWQNQIGWLRDTGRTIVIGEWGGKYSPGTRDEQWQNAIVDWLAEKKICDTFYWNVSPYPWNTKGIFTDDWLSTDDRKIALLQNLWSKCGWRGQKGKSVHVLLHGDSLLQSPAFANRSETLQHTLRTSSFLFRQQPCICFLLSY
eukprot:TRINITY_DN19654_c0_g1_i1.p1 TRINITY_DN19654_c0_g1~~TRINITY_DN19654_c0_g1_i1.p1  ORF type:complete len:432 (+),score=51.63 TRINITY_DN19654_c0_g1_i1:182-1477(+)